MKIIVGIVLITLAIGIQLSHAENNSILREGLIALDDGDYKTAAEKFAKGFEQGEVDGAFYLGRMLELGLGGTPDLQASIGLYIAGGAKNSALAKNRLGVLHILGTGVLQDYVEGAKLLCEAAELGDVNGAYNCGSVMLEGKGVEKDEVKALDWFRVASDKGHLGAKNQVANALIEGKFIERDIEGAVELFQQTAAEGNPVGLFSLGQAFAAGLGVDQDLVKAHSYFNIAAALQHPLAAGARDALEERLTADEIRLAQQLARAWRPKSGGTAE